MFFVQRLQLDISFMLARAKSVCAFVFFLQARGANRNCLANGLFCPLLRLKLKKTPFYFPAFQPPWRYDGGGVRRRHVLAGLTEAILYNLPLF